MYQLTEAKRTSLEKLSYNGIISALAFDQRGALKRMMVDIKKESQQYNKWRL